MFSQRAHLALQALEEVKVRQASVVQLQKRIAESDTKLKQQQSLYETVRSDRNLYSKNLNEAQVRPRSSRD